MLLSAAACGKPPQEVPTTRSLHPRLEALAVREARQLQAEGRRVWCVPFARNVSGIEIRGNAGTWWGQAKDKFARSNAPAVGSVMAFSATPSLPLGHLAVVSEVLSPRLILVDHANWHRNRISLNMAVRDVSDGNDWSKVRVRSQPSSFGSVYAVSGFISSRDVALAQRTP